MRIRIDDGVRLLDADRFDAFDVEVAPGVDAGTSLREADAGGPAAEKGQVDVRVDAVRRMAGARAEDAGWTAAFDGMLRYAAAKGWLSADGKRIRAHVVGGPSTGEH